MVGKKLAIDFGSANLTIYAENKGIVLREPSLMIYDKFDGTLVAMGEKASRMRERLPASMEAVVPIKDGSVNHYEGACRMMREYIEKLCAGRFFKPSVLMSVSGSVTSLEKKTLIDVISQAGAGRACFVEEALAAAVGSGISLKEPKGSFICDIGGGMTDCAVISMGNIVVEKSVRVGGNDLTNAIKDHVFHEYGIEIGRNTADEIKKTVGSAISRTEELAVMVSGKNCESGLPVFFEVTSGEIYLVLKPFLESILECIRNLLEQTPVELLSDVAENGIMLSGGSAHLFGLDRFIEWNTGIETRKVSDPDDSAVLGLGKLWKHPDFLSANGYVFLSNDEENDA